MWLSAGVRYAAGFGDADFLVTGSCYCRQLLLLLANHAHHGDECALLSHVLRSRQLANDGQ